MADIIEIQDFSAAELAVYARLTEHQLRRQGTQGLFIAESTRVIRSAFAAGMKPVSFLMERRHITGKAANLLAACPGVPVYTADDSLLASLTGYSLSRGVLAAFPRPAAGSVEAILAGSRRIAVLEDVTDAVNMGAILRSAAALGIDAVLLSPRCCDPLGRRAVRVSMGGVFQVPWARASGWPDALKKLKENGFYTLALALRKEAVKLDDPALMAHEKLALVLGTEGEGLREETISLCDASVMIPMANGADSLNVAAAAAIAFWQLRKQD